MKKISGKADLTPEQYRVLREKGTEPPFSGKYLRNDDDGVYRCVGCGAELFRTDAQFESQAPGLAGWPSFSHVLDDGAVVLRPDDSFGMHRTEVVCAKCDGHLGHLFDDPESETGKHFCINSCALDFTEDEKSGDG